MFRKGLSRILISTGDGRLGVVDVVGKRGPGDEEGGRWSVAAVTSLWWKVSTGNGSGKATRLRGARGTGRV